MLTLTETRTALTVETLGGGVAFDAARGGQLVALTVKDDLCAHPLLAAGAALPDLRFTAGGRSARLADARASMAVTRRDADSVRVSTRATLFDGALTVAQDYEVHEEGLLFSNLAVEVPSGRTVRVEACSCEVALDLRPVRRGRWGHFMRDYTFKRDFSSLHALPMFKGFLPLDQAADARELFPLVSLDLGWEGTRYFSNHVEFFLEDWAALGDGPRQELTRTRVGRDGGLWRLRWDLLEGGAASLAGPGRYRNRWGLAFGRARTRGGPGTDPAVRNNLLGRRVCHLKAPYARQGNRWPWVSMPIKQVAEQQDQLFTGNPDLACVDEAADLGANLMIVHQFWMENPGSNNEPVADYRPNDPAWLRAFVDRCHARGLRVLLYARGTEMWFQFSPFFEEFLDRDSDGIYVDWNTPFSMGVVRCSPMHVSLHNYFHFTKAVRARIGLGGGLVGHAGFSNLVSLACFDVLLGGETSVRHDELLVNPESSAYYAHLDCCGAHLIGGNLGDRAAFAGARAAALCAAFGMTSQVNMEPGTSFADRVAFIRPLWDAMASLPDPIVRYHNPAYAPTNAVATDAPELFPSLWQSARGQALLLVTNLADQPVAGTVRVDLRELDVPAGARIRPLPIEGTFRDAAADGQTVSLRGIPPLCFAAFRIG